VERIIRNQSLEDDQEANGEDHHVVIGEDHQEGSREEYMEARQEARGYDYQEAMQQRASGKGALGDLWRGASKGQ
jgi:hypothetical protein